MVIASLSGGLGNQILEYAVARGIADKRGDVPAIDASWYLSPGRLAHEEYMLNEYPLQYGEQISQQKLFQATGCLTQTGKYSHLKYFYNAIQHARTIYRIFPKKNCFFYDRMQNVTDTSSIKGDICFYGYPFDYSFFRGISQELRDEFVPLDIPHDVREFAEQISPEAVSVHIRVRDEGNVPLAAYYDNAAVYISERVNAPIFYVFSNNPKIAKKTLRFPGKTVFVENFDAVRTLYLMSRFKRHIIAESTFSWCGAWLSGAEGRDILYPKGWASSWKPPVLVPEDWIPVEGMLYS